MAKSQAELAVQLTATKEQVVKIRGEQTSLIEKIRILTEAIANGPQVSPEVEAAANALDAEVKGLDEQVADPAE